MMNYVLEMITTVAACEALLQVALDDKKSLERRQRGTWVGSNESSNFSYWKASMSFQINPKSPSFGA
jgi:hypothetical protein